MDLINELISGTVEYRDNGEMLRHPPTAVMLRAARILTAMDKEHTENLNMLLKSQQYNNDLLEQIQRMQKEINELTAKLNPLQESISE